MKTNKRPQAPTVANEKKKGTAASAMERTGITRPTRLRATMWPKQTL